MSDQQKKIDNIESNLAAELFNLQIEYDVMQLDLDLAKNKTISVLTANDLRAYNFFLKNIAGDKKLSVILICFYKALEQAYYLSEIYYGNEKSIKQNDKIIKDERLALLSIISDFRIFYIYYIVYESCISKINEQATDTQAFKQYYDFIFELGRQYKGLLDRLISVKQTSYGGQEIHELLSEMSKGTLQNHSLLYKFGSEFNISRVGLSRKTNKSLGGFSNQLEKMHKIILNGMFEIKRVKEAPKNLLFELKEKIYSETNDLNDTLKNINLNLTNSIDYEVRESFKNIHFIPIFISNIGGFDKKNRTNLSDKEAGCLLWGYIKKKYNVFKDEFNHINESNLFHIFVMNELFISDIGLNYKQDIKQYFIFIDFMIFYLEKNLQSYYTLIEKTYANIWCERYKVTDKSKLEKSDNVLAKEIWDKLLLDFNNEVFLSKVETLKKDRLRPLIRDLAYLENSPVDDLAEKGAEPSLFVDMLVNKIAIDEAVENICLAPFSYLKDGNIKEIDSDFKEYDSKICCGLSTQLLSDLVNFILDEFESVGEQKRQEILKAEAPNKN